MSWTSGLQLKVVEGQERGRTIRLDHPEVTLGRAQTKGERAPGWIFFNEPTVSRVHAILSWDDSRKHYILNHRSKTNASLVNGSPVDHHPITIGTRLQLGLLVLEMQNAETGATPRSGRLGDAVTGPSDRKKNESVVGPILEALSNLGEERAPASSPTTTRSNPALRPPTRNEGGPDPWASFNSNASANANPFRTPAPSTPAPPPQLPVMRAPGPVAAHVPEPEPEPEPVLEPEPEPEPPRRLPPALSFSPPPKPSPALAFTPSPPEPEPSGEAERPAAYRIIVAEGPDQGKKFPLLESVLIIGRSMGPTDPRAEMGVLLVDDELPSEVAMLVWQGREQAYGILQADNTQVEIRVRRTVNGAPRELRVSKDAPTLLQEGDVLQMGRSVLVMRRAETSGSVARKVSLTTPGRSPFRSSVGSSGPQSTPPSEQTVPEPESGWEKPVAPTEEVRTPSSLVGDGPAYPGGVPAFNRHTEDPWSNAASTRPPAPPPASPPPAPPEPPPSAEPVRSEPTLLGPPRPGNLRPDSPSGSMRRPLSLADTPAGARPEPVRGVPPRPTPPPPPPVSTNANALKETMRPSEPTRPMDLAELGTIGSSPARRAAASGSQPAFDGSKSGGSLQESPIGEDLPDLGALTWPWRFRADFVFDYLKGVRRGSQISLVGAEMTEDRIINIGIPGERLNDIEVGGPNVINAQAQLKFRTGRFSLLNQGPPDVVFINRVPMKTGDQVVLVTGDLIETGDTQVRFLERKVVETLSSYLVEVESGVDADQGKQFQFTKQRLLIGRGKNCDIHLNDLEVSRLHAALAYRDGRFYLQHRSDTNPTFVNGMSVLPGSERMITPDDRIRLSSLTVLRFVLKGMPAAGGPPPQAQPQPQPQPPSPQPGGGRGLTRK